MDQVKELKFTDDIIMSASTIREMKDLTIRSLKSLRSDHAKLYPASLLTADISECLGMIGDTPFP